MSVIGICFLILGGAVALAVISRKIVDWRQEKS